MAEIIKCVCGNTKYHSAACKRANRYFRIYERRKNIWKERVDKNCCGDCGVKVKPKTIFPSRCEECNLRSNKKR